jgi:hypothetical protein
MEYTNKQITDYVEEVLDQVRSALKTIHSKHTIDTYPVKKWIKYVNDKNPLEIKLVDECPKCKMVFMHPVSNLHTSKCDGTWIPTREKSTKLDEKDKVKYKKKELYEKVLPSAIEEDDWNEYDRICNEIGLRGRGTRRKWLKKLGLHERFLERFESMKSYSYYTETNCSTCNKEIRVRKQLLKKYPNQYCSVECGNYGSAWGSVQQTYGDRFKTYEEFKDWRDEIYEKRSAVIRRVSKQNFKKYKPEEYKKWKLSNGKLHIDHIFPVCVGVEQEVPDELMCHTDNLRLLPSSENSSKNSSVDLEIIPQIIIESLSSDYIDSLSSLSKGLKD